MKEELKEKNYVIRNLLNRIKTNNCVIFPKMSMTNDDESYIGTSSESTMENENQNLINLNEDINTQSENNLNNTHSVNSICINESLITQDEISLHEQHNDIKTCNNTYDENINKQLTTIRQIQHDDYLKTKTQETSTETNQTNKWPAGTILIASDSICGGLDEKRLSKNNKAKVRCFPGATINNMFYYLKPLLQKKPDYIILHVSTNDVITKTSDIILNELMELQSHIENTLPSCTVIISEPTIRLDIAKASLTIKQINEKLRNMNINMLRNDNITANHISKKGLHLNAKGTGRLALNIITCIRYL